MIFRLRLFSSNIKRFPMEIEDLENDIRLRIPLPVLGGPDVHPDQKYWIRGCSMHQLTCPCVIGINIGYFELIRYKPWVFYDQVYLRKLCIQNRSYSMLLWLVLLLSTAAPFPVAMSLCVLLCSYFSLSLSFSLFLLAAALKEVMSIRIGRFFAYVITSVHPS